VWRAGSVSPSLAAQQDDDENIAVLVRVSIAAFFKAGKETEYVTPFAGYLAGLINYDAGKLNSTPKAKDPTAETDPATYTPETEPEVDDNISARDKAVLLLLGSDPATVLVGPHKENIEGLEIYKALAGMKVRPDVQELIKAENDAITALDVKNKEAEAKANAEKERVANLSPSAQAREAKVDISSHDIANMSATIANVAAIVDNRHDGVGTAEPTQAMNLFIQNISAKMKDGKITIAELNDTFTAIINSLTNSELINDVAGAIVLMLHQSLVQVTKEDGTKVPILKAMFEDPAFKSAVFGWMFGEATVNDVDDWSPYATGSSASGDATTLAILNIYFPNIGTVRGITE
jgi:hypothetical protein